MLKYEVVKCIEEIIKWSFVHYMKINPDKTEIMLFRPSSLNNEVIINGIFIEGQCIRFSDEVKNVGVWLDKNLTMNKHVNNIVSHCYKILRNISRIKKYLQRTHRISCSVQKQILSMHRLWNNLSNLTDFR